MDQGQAPVLATLAISAAATVAMVGACAVRLRRPPGRWELLDAALALALMVWGSATVSLAAGVLAEGPALVPDDISLASAVLGTALGGLAAAAFALARAARGGHVADLGLRLPRWWGWLVALGLVPVFLAASAGWVALLELLGHSVEEQLIVQEVLDAPGSPAAAATIAYGVLVAPLVEELIFRAFLLAPLRHRLGGGAAIVLTALAFGLLHLADPASVVPLVGLGALLAWLRLRTDSLGPPVLLHVVNNALAFAFALSQG